MKKTSDDEQVNAIFKTIDALVGPIEEWDARDVDDTLAKAGIDVDSVSKRLFEMASDLAGQYRVRNEDVPRHLQDFLQQTRPPELPTSDPDTVMQSAKRWVDNLFKPKPAPATLEVVYSFRGNDQELDTKDQDFLDRLGERVKNAEEKKGDE
jgi:hypothetical protein